MRKYKESPCEACRRVPDPRQCENKECKYWRNWFINRWERLRRMYLRGEDPCKSCPCAEQMCFEACGRKRQWEAERKVQP